MKFVLTASSQLHGVCIDKSCSVRESWGLFIDFRYALCSYWYFIRYSSRNYDVSIPYFQQVSSRSVVS